MRVLQLIDTLRPGGAERMAVNLANALLPHIEGSYLCCTRMEGELKEALNPNVHFLFLNKKNSLDSKAFDKLKKFIKKNNIEIVHAHGTSYFLGGLLKLSGANIKLVWHEHYGGRISKKGYDLPLLFLFSFFFDSVITVNKELLKWVKKNLKARNEQFIPNFVPSRSLPELQNIRDLEERYIVCLANLKVPKNHLNLIKSFHRVTKEFPEYKLYLIGKCYDDFYENQLKIYINDHNLTRNVIFMGEIVNNADFLKNAAIGVLSSDSEGLPMALLEYGNVGIPVVCTDVGQCDVVVNGFGKIIPYQDDEALANGIIYYLKNPEIAKEDGILFHNHVEKNFSEKVIIHDFQSLYNKLFI